MSCAVELSKTVGQDKPVNDITDAYDAEYGKYEMDVHPAPPKASLPAEPSPFAVKKK